MKKKNWSKNGMKQIIDSGWKLFDKQTNCITTGNAYCNTQYSSFIRPWIETECNGFEREKGVLMNYDLRPFMNFRIPESIQEILADKERNDSVILYMFFVYKDDRIKPFCFAVTDRDNNLIDYRIRVGYNESYMKRFNAAQEAISYITA